MNELPLELLERIVHYLPIHCKLRCREISKKFKYTIDHSKNKELIILNREFEPFIWFDDHTLIDERNLIDSKSSRSFNKFDSVNYFRNPFFANLKKIFIDIKDYKNPDRCALRRLDFLNNLYQLQTLSIRAGRFQATRLRLPNLRNLELFTGFEKNEKLILDTPTKLIYLHVYQFDILKIVDSNTVRHISTSVPFSHIFEWTKSLKTFVHLETLEFDIFHDADVFVSHIVRLAEKLTDLKELSIEVDLETNLEELEKFSKKMISLKIYVNGLNIHCLNRINSIGEYMELGKKLDIYLCNYSSAYKCLPVIRQIDYSGIESRWTSLPGDLFKRLIRIRSIITTRKINRVDHFKQLLVSCRLVEHLQLTRSALENNFYEQLNDWTPYLNELIIDDEDDIVDRLNLDFLFRFRFLNEFETNKKCNLNFVRELFLEFRNISFVRFRLSNNNSVGIARYIFKHYEDGNNVDERLKWFVRQLTIDYHKKYGEVHSDKSQFVFEIYNMNS